MLIVTRAFAAVSSSKILADICNFCCSADRPIRREELRCIDARYRWSGRWNELAQQRIFIDAEIKPTGDRSMRVDRALTVLQKGAGIVVAVIKVVEVGVSNLPRPSPDGCAQHFGFWLHNPNAEMTTVRTSATAGNVLAIKSGLLVGHRIEGAQTHSHRVAAFLESVEFLLQGHSLCSPSRVNRGDVLQRYFFDHL
jgi:hypothetical protein